MSEPQAAGFYLQEYHKDDEEVIANVNSYSGAYCAPTQTEP